MRLLPGALRNPSNDIISHAKFLILKNQESYTGIIPLRLTGFSLEQGDPQERMVPFLKEIETICHFYTINMNITQHGIDASINLLIRGNEESDLALDCSTTIREIDRIRDQTFSNIICFPSSPLELVAFPLKDIPTSRKTVGQDVLEFRSQYRLFLKNWVLTDTQNTWNPIITALSPQLCEIGSRIKFSLTVVPPAFSSNSDIKPHLTMHRHWLVGGNLFVCSPIYSRLEQLETKVQSQLDANTLKGLQGYKAVNFSNLTYQEQHLQLFSDAESLEIFNHLQNNFEEKSTNIN
jgi:hypothetical protein